MSRLWSLAYVRSMSPGYSRLLVSAASVVGGLFYFYPAEETTVQEQRGALQYQIVQSEQGKKSPNEGWIAEISRMWAHVRTLTVRMAPSAVQNSTNVVESHQTEESHSSGTTQFVGRLWRWIEVDYFCEWMQSRNTVGDNVDIMIESILRTHPHSFKTIMEPLVEDIISRLRKESQDICALSSLTGIANCSTAGADLIALNGVGKIILDLLSQGNELKHELFGEVLRLATSLADNCPRPDLLEAEQWLKPLLLLMADGIARNTPTQLQSVLMTLDAVVRTKQRKVLQALKRGSIIWHLLKKLATMNDSHIQTLASSLLSSLADGGLRLPDGEGSFWQSQLLCWTMDGSASLSSRASEALQSISVREHRSERSGDSLEPGPRSFLLARKWLSHVLVALSTSPYISPQQSSRGVELSEPWVIPSYIRYVADGVLEKVPVPEPPEYLDVHKVEHLTLDWEEDESDETAISRGLSILCDFAADNDQLCEWLVKVDVLTPCSILMSRKVQSMKEQQQLARLLALLFRKSLAQERFADWLPWLRRAVESSDVFLASNALRALIHIYSSQMSVPDSIHFFNPCAAILENIVLDQQIDEDTDVDVVFVHGIRGGPYLTWRIDGSSDSKHSAESCWPSNWLCSDVPHVRLFSVSFAAPFSSWEGGSISLQVTATNLLDKLRECRLGSRPLVFVAHSMGGLIVKELIARALQDSQLSDIADNTRGIIFISTPHHGVWLAHLAWGLRHIGAYPAPSVNDMKPGPYLEELNCKIRQWVIKKNIRILNFSETLSTDVSSMMPRIHVVTSVSASPGFGKMVSLEGLDHINSCKPKSRTDVFYQHTLEFLTSIVQELK